MTEGSEHFFRKCRNIDEVFRFFEGRSLFPGIESAQAGYPGGFCYICDSQVSFKLETGAHAQDINWRETVTCPGCGLINRWRSSVHLFELLTQPGQRERIYMTEQLTSLYGQFLRRYPEVQGSEFDAQHASGSMIQVDDKPIMIQDVTQLSFADRQFDSVLSMDVLEHVPDYSRALTEFSRVIDDKGMLIISVPFSFAYETLIRAEIGPDGEVVHLMDAEYHEDPLSSQGVLCFQSFGMDLLDSLREVGFRDSYVLAFNSIPWGYPDRNLLFIAHK